MLSNFGSNAPSTPNFRRTLDDQPSTTPAGPPPSSLTQNSTTPAGPPPSSAFGSSQNQLHSRPSARLPPPKFQSPALFTSRSPQSYIQTTSFAEKEQQRPGTTSTDQPNTFRVPSSSPPPQDEDDEYAREQESDSDAMDEDVDLRSQRALPTAALQSSLPHSASSRAPYSPRKSKFGSSVPQSLILDGGSAVPETNNIAKGLAAAMSEPALQEPSSMVLDTEEILGRLKANSQANVSSEEDLANIAKSLCELWSRHAGQITRKSRKGDSIGPSDKEDPLVKAAFVAELLLRIHHPPRREPRQNLSSSRFGRSSLISTTAAIHPEPIPKILLDWLNQNHDAMANDINDVFSETAGYSAADNYWDVVFACLFRGRFLHVIKLLKGANWRAAACATEDGYENPGYTGRQLQQVEVAANRMIAILESCPAVKNDNWDVKGSDWTLFRHRVRHDRAELKAQADERRAAGGDLFNPNDSTASARSSVFGISTSSRNPDNRLPSFVAESLDDMFGTLLGGPHEVMMSACDWVEGVIGITAWWDGESSNETKESLDMGRRALRKPQHSRPSDITPLLAYRQKLGEALAHVWSQDDEELQANASNPVEVAVACVFADDVDGALAILQSWSLTIASAVAEVASSAGWLDSDKNRRAQQISRNFSQSDLMVLDYGKDQDRDIPTTHDEVLIKYSSLLRGVGSLTPPEAPRRVEGWELAARVLSRLHSESLAKNKISEVLEQLPLGSEETATKLLDVCQNLDMEDLARSIAQRYADQLSASTNQYGSAIMYYARSHNSAKLKGVLDLLVSHCLVTSTAYPPIVDMDLKLKSLVTSPRQALAGLARTDEEAAILLSTHLSGYATLRRFYDLRDEDVCSVSGHRLTHKPLARRKEAANALAAVIASAGDSIHGGLFDPEVDAAMQVDGLLVLLGEALVFLNQAARTFSLDQAFALIQAAEDLQTVGSRIQEQCETVLRAALANYHDGSLPQSLSPTKRQQQQPRSLQTSRSAMSGSQFSLIGSSAFNSQEMPSPVSGSGSVMLVRQPGTSGKSNYGGDGKRGWDWRVGFARGATGKDVLGVLKLALAKEIADGWQEDD